jgi:hypothetical protein
MLANVLLKYRLFTSKAVSKNRKTRYGLGVLDVLSNLVLIDVVIEFIVVIFFLEY